MHVIDLTDEHRDIYFMCLEEWSDDVKEGYALKEQWFERIKDRGLRVKFAVDDAGQLGGMIHYVPIEQSFVDGRDLYFILCIWVHGHKQGRGNHQRKGMGQALLKAAENDARELGAKGMAAWGLVLPFWMRAAWFRKHGYVKADRDGIAALLWKPFTDDAVAPKWFRPPTIPETVPGKVTVTSFVNGWCPAQNLICERAKRATAEFGETVEFRETDTFERETVRHCGIADALFVDGKAVRTGPPPSYEKIRNVIAKRVKRVGAQKGS